MNETEMAGICKALGDNNRLRIIRLLSDGEKCGCKLLEAFNFTQPTLSHHMKILTDCAMVEARKDGRWQHYSINSRTLREFMDCLDTLSGAAAEREDC